MSISAVSNGGDLRPVPLMVAARRQREEEAKALAFVDFFIRLRDQMVVAAGRGPIPFAVTIHVPHARLHYVDGGLHVDGSALSPFPLLWDKGFTEERASIPLTVNLSERYLAGAQRTLMTLLNDLWTKVERAHSRLQAIGVAQASRWPSSQARLLRLTNLTGVLIEIIDRINAIVTSEREFLTRSSESAALREFDSLLHDIRSLLQGLRGNMELWETQSIPKGRDFDLSVLVPPTDLGSFFEKERMRHEKDARQQEAQLAIHFPPEIAEWKLNSQTNRLLLTWIVNNFLGNAIKYSDDTKAPEDRWVRLVAEIKGKELVIEIADSGIGMSRSFLRNHYGKYRHRAKEVVGGPIKGTGVGVYSALSRLRLLGGRLISAESELGRGSTIRVALPISYFGNGEVAKSTANFVSSMPRVPIRIHDVSPPRSPLLGKSIPKEQGEIGSQRDLLFRLKRAGHSQAAADIEGLFGRGHTTHSLRAAGRHHLDRSSSHQDRLALLPNPAERNRALILMGAESLGAVSASSALLSLCIVP